MTKGTTILLLAFLLLAGGSASAQFGVIIYTGQSSADLYMGKLTDQNYSKVEFFRGARKLGEITNGGPNGGIVTDYGLSKGVAYQYEFRAHRTTGGFLQGQVGLGFIIGGEIRGILTRRDTISINTVLIDSVFIFPGGPVNPEVSVPGGHLHFASGCDLTYSVAMSGKVSGIKIYDTESPSFPPGKMTSSGGRIKDINTHCWGQAGPLHGMTFVGSDIFMYTKYPSVITNCQLTYNTDQGRNDFSYFVHDHNMMDVSLTTVRDECQMIGAIRADRMTIEYDGVLTATDVTNSMFRSNGQLNLRPINEPTSCRNSTFKGGTSNSSLNISNQSVVEFNTMEYGTTLTLSSIAGGFDSADVKKVRINFNEFQREEQLSLILSTVKTDTIDVTKNYWGNCTGPTSSERLGRAARFDPFLRAKYPATSYWFDISPSKKNIIADGEDEVVFTGHFWNVITEQDSAGATVDYLVRVLGKEVQKGTLTMDANGMCTLSVKIPVEYRTAISAEVYFTSIQCIQMSYILMVSEPSGSDLQVQEAYVQQAITGEKSLTANKPFMVKAMLYTEEPVTTKFKVHVTVNNHVYDTFYVFDNKSLGLEYQLENPLTEINLPKGESPTLYFPINETGLGVGSYQVVVTVDPTDAQNPKGRVIEPIETNNELAVPFTVAATKWGNEGTSGAKVFVQAIDGFSRNRLEFMRRTTDTTKSFIESSWPMNAGQISFTTDSTVADYSWLNPDTLRAETWQYYLMKSYKQLRMSQPAYDRYVFAVDRDWFGTRLHPIDFPHRLSQTLSWSGIYDLMLVSAQSYKYLAHSLGHSFGLRRHDFGSTDPDTQEEYYNYFVGKEVYEAVDPFSLRIIHYGLKNKVGYLQKAYCFMGNTKIPGESNKFNIWICDVDHAKLQNTFHTFRGNGGSFSKPTVAKGVFIEGSVDSTTKAFTFGPWMTLDNATASNMVDSAWATHIFKTLDGNGTELARYYYRPTFTALGLDEAADQPFFEKEYFAFVMPFNDQVRKVVVTKDNQVVIERNVSANPPVVAFTYPKNSDKVPEGGSFIARWGATDPDGDTEFWYTVYFSTDGGLTWKLIAFESQLTESIIRAPKGRGYKLKIIGTDGIHSDEDIVTFDIENSTELPAAPGEYVLHQNYPNPFNPSTLIRYTLPVSGQVTVEVFDALGRPVETLYKGLQEAGNHAVTFDAGDHPSGVYTAVLRAGNAVRTIRMTLSK